MAQPNAEPEEDYEYVADPPTWWSTKGYSVHQGTMGS